MLNLSHELSNQKSSPNPRLSKAFLDYSKPSPTLSASDVTIEPDSTTDQGQTVNMMLQALWASLCHNHSALVSVGRISHRETYTKGPGCVPIKLYLQEQARGPCFADPCCRWSCCCYYVTWLRHEYIFSTLRGSPCGGDSCNTSPSLRLHSLNIS